MRTQKPRYNTRVQRPRALVHFPYRLIERFSETWKSRDRWRLLNREALPEKSDIILDRVSTGSGSDVVSDQHAISPVILDSYG